jgi:hypothetical protein
MRNRYSGGESFTPTARPAPTNWLAANSFMSRLAATIPAPRQTSRGQTIPSANDSASRRIGPPRREGNPSTTRTSHAAGFEACRR